MYDNKNKHDDVLLEDPNHSKKEYSSPFKFPVVRFDAPHGYCGALVYLTKKEVKEINTIPHKGAFVILREGNNERVKRLGKLSWYEISGNDDFFMFIELHDFYECSDSVSFEDLYNQDAIMKTMEKYPEYSTKIREIGFPKLHYIDILRLVDTYFLKSKIKEIAWCRVKPISNHEELINLIERVKRYIEWKRLWRECEIFDQFDSDGFSVFVDTPLTDYEKRYNYDLF